MVISNGQELKSGLKQMFQLKREIAKNNASLKELRTVMKFKEKKIIHIMEELGVTEVKVNGGKSKIEIERKVKKAPANKKHIKERLLEYCKGNTEQAKSLEEFIYDKNAREKTTKTALKQYKVKQKK